MDKIPFNKPYIIGKEKQYINNVLSTGKLSGNGEYTKKCQLLFKEKYNFKKCLLTTSCTDALEMAAILLDIKPDDEVILPSYAYSSTANAFMLRGAKLVFADSNDKNPNIEVKELSRLITPKTKAIIIVHYAGIACDMDAIMDFARLNNLFVIEDAAQAIDSYYKGKALGSFGHFAAFSFHSTKNIISGEGGMLVINDEKFIKRAEIIWEKGTNKIDFDKGNIDKYEWVDIGSSFFPSELTAAFLYAQLENINDIQNKRKRIWDFYYNEFSKISSPKINLPNIPEYATNNAHMFYLNCTSLDERNRLIEILKKKNILAVFHYTSLHNSPFYKDKHNGIELINSEKYSNNLLRLPFYYSITEKEQLYIIDTIKQEFLLK